MHPASSIAQREAKGNRRGSSNNKTMTEAGQGQSVKLPSGKRMPLNGFGTWKAPASVTKEVVIAALETGYRHVDCAAVYMNEAAVGEGLKVFLSENKDVKRSDLFITSKVWNTCHARDKVVEACKQSLKDLGLDYVDLWLVHHPFAWEFGGLPIVEENWIARDGMGKIRWAKGVSLEMTWRGMEDCVELGLARDIGVSNYSVMLLMDLLQYARIRPAVNQCEAHVYNNRKDLREICEEFGIHFTMYSILGSGNKGPLGDEVVKGVAKRAGITVAQTLIGWGIGRGCSVLAKSERRERILENFGGGDVKLEEVELEKLDGLDCGLLVCDMREYWGFASHA